MASRQLPPPAVAVAGTFEGGLADRAPPFCRVTCASIRGLFTTPTSDSFPDWVVVSRGKLLPARVPTTGALECRNRRVVGVRKRVQVLLGGLDLAVPHAVHHGLEVSPAGQEPGCVGMA